MTPMGCEYLEWDSSFFGKRIARLNQSGISPAILAEADLWCAKHHVECLYLLVPGHNMTGLRLAGKFGYELVDIRVELSLALDSGTPEMTNPGAVSPARPDDRAALVDLAASVFSATRFFNDAHFEKERCRELYRIWLNKSLDDRANEVLVSRSETDPCGFITCHRLEDKGSIGLFGVAKHSRGQGHGQTLIASAVDRFRRMGCVQVDVVTQGSNISAQKLYQQYGFRTRQVAIWFHKWFTG